MATVTADPVGVVELAERLGVAARTVRMWRERSASTPVPMPEPTYANVNGSPAWEWLVVLRWAGVTGHLAYLPAIDAYEEAFDEAPLDARRGGRMSADAAEYAEFAVATAGRKRKRR